MTLKYICDITCENTKFDVSHIGGIINVGSMPDQETLTFHVDHGASVFFSRS
jgi:hypothetical protein